jgi:arylformamidase
MTAFRIEPERLLDISMPLGAGTPSYPGDTPFSREIIRQDGFVSSRLILSSHSGTHMDPPAHLEGGSPTSDSLPMDRLIVPAIILDARGMSSIGPLLLTGLEFRGRALLFRTGAPRGLSDAMPGLDPVTARLAVGGGAVMVGTDAISIDRPGSVECHHILLPASVPVLENLLLDGVEAGEYLMLCFPLPLENGDGAPVRVFLQPKPYLP